MRHSRKLRRRAGFTMIEALIVVAIIAVTAALAAPGLSRAMAIRRASETSHDIVRMGALARSEAMMYGRAHLLIYTENTAEGRPLGRLTVWRGRSDRCNGNAWATLVTPACTRAAGCVEVLDMDERATSTHEVRVAPQDARQTPLCFQPNGEMYISTSGAVVGPYTNRAAVEGVVFDIDRRENGSPVGVQRNVIFPFGGNPRIQR
ncbi:MAG: prepilin-type N-terminal cleavage/methylation domain-containing protein [Sandaracinaceae bacterium]